MSTPESVPPPSDDRRRILVLGGARSGKSAYAESLMDSGPVRYIATAIPDPADSDFAARIAAHQARRPNDWTVLDSADPVKALHEPHFGTTLVDDLGTWLTARFDAREAWDAPRGTLAAEMDGLVSAVAHYRGRLVLVSPEVGLGVIPATRSGRLFRDEIGTLNQRLAQVCDEARLVVAGLPLRLK